MGGGKGSADLEKHIFVDERLSRAMRVEGIWLGHRSDRGGYKDVGFLEGERVAFRVDES